MSKGKTARLTQTAKAWTKLPCTYPSKESRPRWAWRPTITQEPRKSRPICLRRKNFKSRSASPKRNAREARIVPQETEIAFIQEVKELLNSARERTKAAINIAMVYTYYEIGRRILKQEQKGLNRAEYGKKILKQLSSALTKEFGKGCSISNLKSIRQFFVVYSQDRIGQTAFSQSQNLPTTLEGRRFYLGWGHYVRLMRISNLEERHFYGIETYKNNWSVRELNRQFDDAKGFSVRNLQAMRQFYELFPQDEITQQLAAQIAMVP